jgi:hypothetical protein
MTVKIRKLKTLMVNQQQHAVLRRQQRVDTGVWIARVAHGRSLPKVGGLKSCNLISRPFDVGRGGSMRSIHAFGVQGSLSKKR